MRILLLLALSTALTGPLVLIQGFRSHANASNETSDSLSYKLNELIQAYDAAHGFNGSVLVARGGTVLLNKGYGWRDAAHKLPNNGQTRFQIASTTKTFTSTLVLRLAAGRRLALTDKLSRWYPQLPFADSVTIEQMLSHTSGIYDFTHEQGPRAHGEKGLLDVLMTHPLDFPPGAQWRYSNSNFVLLGYIAGKIMGTDYFHAVRTTIFEPLHMENSGFDFVHLQSPDKAIGYQTLDDSLAIPDEIADSTEPAGAGAIYSTVEDLYRWHLGLQTEKILPRQWQQQAYQKYHGNGYGFGWTVDSLAGKLVVSHSGAISGFGGDFERVPEDDVCVVVLSNKSGSTFDATDISRSILAILYNQPYSIPKKWAVIHLSAEQLKTYNGVYEFPEIGFTFRIWEEDGSLYVQSASRPGPRSTLLPTGDDHFVSKEGGDAQCWFDREKGTLTFTQRGRTFTGKKSK